MDKKNETMMSAKAHATFASMGLGSQENKVEEVKTAAAVLWDKIDSISVAPGQSQDAMGMMTLAKTNLEQSVMWAIKAISRSGV